MHYRAVRYTERLAQAEAVASVSSTGASYNNAIAEALNSLFTAELIRDRIPWFGRDDRRVAVAECVDWFNQRRLPGENEHIPPVEAETNCYTHKPTNPQTHKPTNPQTHKLTNSQTHKLTNPPSRGNGPNRASQHPILDNRPFPVPVRTIGAAGADEMPGQILFGNGLSPQRTLSTREGWSPPQACPAVSAGANVKALQRMLHHASAAMTRDAYAALFSDDLDSVAPTIDQARMISRVGKMWSNGAPEKSVPK